MAVAFIQEFPIEAGGDRSTTNYDAINAKLTTNQEAPDGLIVHYAGFDEDAGVFRIVNLWESQEQGQAYLEQKVMPAVRQVVGDDLSGGVPPSRETWYELHHVAGV